MGLWLPFTSFRAILTVGWTKNYQNANFARLITSLYCSVYLNDKLFRKKGTFINLSGKCRTAFAATTVDRVLFGYFNLRFYRHKDDYKLHIEVQRWLLQKILGLRLAMRNTPGWVVIFSRSENIARCQSCTLSKNTR